MSHTKPKVLLLDMFGVVITEGHIITNGTTQIWPERSVQEQRAAYYAYEQDTIDAAEFWKRIGSPLPPRESERQLFDRFALDADFEKLAETVRGRLDMVVISNMPKDWKPSVLEFGIGPHLKRFFTSGEERMWKPNDDFFLHVCTESGVTPQECVFVDDQRRNLEAASKLGMVPVWAKREGQANFASDYYPEYSVKDLGELCSLLPRLFG